MTGTPKSENLHADVVTSEGPSLLATLCSTFHARLSPSLTINCQNIHNHRYQ